MDLLAHDQTSILRASLGMELPRSCHIYPLSGVVPLGGVDLQFYFPAVVDAEDDASFVQGQGDRAALKGGNEEILPNFPKIMPKPPVKPVFNYILLIH